MSSYNCPLCGLRYADRPLLELHIREDHRQREHTAAAPAAPAPDPAPDPAPAPPAAPPPSAARTGSWAETARRALNRMIGRAA
jgi:3-oxoacyl-ACP reductase-like protein